MRSVPRADYIHPVRLDSLQGREKCAAIYQRLVAVRVSEVAGRSDYALLRLGTLRKGWDVLHVDAAVGDGGPLTCPAPSYASVVDALVIELLLRVDSSRKLMSGTDHERMAKGVARNVKFSTGLDLFGFRQRALRGRAARFHGFFEQQTKGAGRRSLSG